MDFDTMPNEAPPPPAQQQMNFDEMPDENQPAPSSGGPMAANAGEPPNFDDMPDETPQRGGVMQSAPAAFARGAVREAAPSAGAVAGGVGGAMLAGGIAGTLVGGPVGGLAGVAIGALGAGIGGFAGAVVTHSAQDALIKELGWDKGTSPFDPYSTTQQQKDIQQHPSATKYGEIAGVLPSLAIAPEATLAERGIAAAGMGAMNIGQQLVEHGKVSDPIEALESAGIGAAAPRPRFMRGFPVPPKNSPGQPSEASAGELAGRPNVELTPEASAEKADVDVHADPVRTLGTAAEAAPTQDASVGNGEAAPMLKTKAEGPEKQYIKRAPAEGEQASGVVINDNNGIAPDIAQVLDEVPWKIGTQEEPIYGNHPDTGDIVRIDPRTGEPLGGPTPEINQKTGAFFHEPAKLPVTEPVTPPQPQQPNPAAALDALNARTVAAPQTPPKPAPEPAVIGHALDTFGKLGYNKVVQKILTAPPEQRAQLAADALTAFNNKGGVAQPGQTVRIPSKRPTLEGSQITARDKGDAARKQQPMNAVKQTFAELGPGKSEVTPDNAQQVARQALARATQLNNGNNPLGTKAQGGYTPKSAPPEYRWLQAAQRVARVNTPKAVQEFLAAHALGGETGNSVEGELARRGARPDVEALAAPETEPDYGERTVFDMTEPEKTRTGKPALGQLPGVRQQNELRSWLNDLTDEDYARLQSTHGEPLRVEVENSTSPGELLSTLKQTLAQAKGGRPTGRITYPEEEGIPTPVEKADDIHGRESTADELTRLIAEQKSEQAEDRINSMPVNPDNDAQQQRNFTTNVMDLLRSEGGAGPAMPFPRWALPTPVTRDTMDVARAMSDELYNMLGKNTNAQSYIRTMFGKAKDIAPDWFKSDTNNPRPSEFRSIYRAREDRAQMRSPLHQRMNDEVVQPIMDKISDLYDKISDLAKTYPSLKIDMPELAQGVEKDWMPRHRLGTAPWEDNDASPFASKRTLPSSGTQLEDRLYRAGIDASGNRVVLRPNDDDTVTIFGVRNDAPLDAGDPRKIGSTATIDGEDYQIDHATAQEIEAAGVRDEDNNPVKFAQNSLMDPAEAYLRLNNIYTAQKFLGDFVNDPRFKAATTTNYKVAKKNGWQPLPDFVRLDGKTTYGHDRLRYSLADFERPGIDWTDGEAVRKMGELALKSLFAVNPLFHVLNVGDEWVTSRGLNWVPKQITRLNENGDRETTGNYRILAKTMTNAVKSVFTQDFNQDRYRALGLHLNLASTLNDKLLPRIAEDTGTIIKERPQWWDPVARVFGLSYKDFAHNWSNWSNKITWALSDILATQRAMEEEENGFSAPAAVENVNKIISTYETQPTFLGSRGLSKIVNSPWLSYFFPYHNGIMNSWGHLVKTSTMGLDPAERRTARGQLATALIMLGVAYPLMDKGLQALSGNKHAEMGRRGLSAIPQIAMDIANGEDPSKLARQVFTPSIPLQGLTTLYTNKDQITGKPVIPPGSPTMAPGLALKQAGKAAAGFLPPVQQVQSALHSGQGIPWETFLALMGKQVGANFPSPQGQKYLEKRDIYNRREIKKIEKANARP